MLSVRPLLQNQECTLGNGRDLKIHFHSTFLALQLRKLSRRVGRASQGKPETGNTRPQAPLMLPASPPPTEVKRSLERHTVLPFQANLWLGDGSRPSQLTRGEDIHL